MARGKGEDFRSKTRLFPLAPSPVPLAWLLAQFRDEPS